jgi:hypothetical protein
LAGPVNRPLLAASRRVRYRSVKSASLKALCWRGAGSGCGKSAFDFLVAFMGGIHG